LCAERRGLETNERRAKARKSGQDVRGSEGGGPEERATTASHGGQVLFAAKEGVLPGRVIRPLYTPVGGVPPIFTKTPHQKKGINILDFLIISR
jgi:hypothetical protein